MAYEKGTAANHRDLLLKLETFLVANKWEVLKDNTQSPYTTDPDVTDWDNQTRLARFFKKGDTVVPMGIREGSNFWNIFATIMKGYDKHIGVTGYKANAAAGHNQGYAGLCVCSMPLWNQGIPYWFITKGEYFIVVAKVSARYASMYCGKFTPYGTDLEYPFPLAIGANSGTFDISYSSNSTGESRSFFNPQSAGYTNQSLYLYLPDGALCGMDNYDGGVPNYSPEGLTQPYSYKLMNTKTKGGNYVLEHIMLIQTTPQRAVLGYFNDVFYVSGVDNSPETEITVNGEKYICFPSFIDSDYNNYAAFKME